MGADLLHDLLVLHHVIREFDAREGRLRRLRLAHEPRIGPQRRGHAHQFCDRRQVLAPARLHGRDDDQPQREPRKAAQRHPIEETGAKLRAMMPWIKANALVDKAKN